MLLSSAIIPAPIRQELADLIGGIDVPHGQRAGSSTGRMHLDPCGPTTSRLLRALKMQLLEHISQLSHTGREIGPASRRLGGAKWEKCINTKTQIPSSPKAPTEVVLLPVPYDLPKGETPKLPLRLTSYS